MLQLATHPVDSISGDRPTGNTVLSIICSSK